MAPSIERRRRENRGAEGDEWGREWEGYPPPQPTRGSGERRELSQRGPGRSPGRQRIFGIFKVHMQNTSGRENIVTLLNDVQSPKAAC